MLIKLPIPYDLCVCIPISCLLTAWVKAHCLILNSVLNVKALVGTSTSHDGEILANLRLVPCYLWPSMENMIIQGDCYTN